MHRLRRHPGSPALAAPTSAVALAASLAASLALGACATTHVTGPTLADEVRALERARLEAMVSADVATLDRILADDLRYGHSTGSVQPKAALLATLRDGSLDYVALTPHAIDVRTEAGVALASGTADVEATAGPRRLKGALRWLAVYARRDGRWQLVAYQSAPLTS